MNYDPDADARRSAVGMFGVRLPNLFDTWLMVIYGLTQHAGLVENVLDHRLDCRTLEMGVVNRFLYSNMNHHIGHHMFRYDNCGPSRLFRQEQHLVAFAFLESRQSALQ